MTTPPDIVPDTAPDLSQHRAHRRRILMHVLLNVLQFDEDDGIVIALEQHFGKRFDIAGLLHISAAQLNKLTQPSTLAENDDASSEFDSRPSRIPSPSASRASSRASPTVNRIPAGDLHAIRILQHFNQYRIKINKPLSHDDWGELGYQEFDDFRLGDYMQQVTITGPPPRLPNSDSTNPRPPEKTPADLFVASVKKDSAAYPTLIKDSQYDSWLREFRAVGRSQSLENLFDPNFVPCGTKATELHTKQQLFLYAILCAKLKTDKGKDLLRKFETPPNAQAILQHLDEYHTKSTKAGLDSANLLSYITSATLGPNTTWNGTTENFILHWINQVRLREANLEPGVQPFDDTLKKVLLQSAVQPIPELAMVRNQEEAMAAAGSARFTFQQYLKLLTSAAQSYDRNMRPTSRTAKRRTVLAHDAYEDPDHSYYGPTHELPVATREVQVHNIDTDIQSLLQPDPDPITFGVHQASHGVRRPGRHHSNARSDGLVRMSREQWQKLDDDAKTTWDKLDQKSKAIILGKVANEQSRQANIHAVDDPPMTQMEYMANVHDRESEDAKPEKEEVPATEEPPTMDKVFAHMAQSDKPLHPGDLRRMMSQATPSKPPPRAAATAFVKYKANVCYRIGQTACTPGTIHSLVDRGANGGVAGSDVRVIHRHTDRSVEIEGIDNHRMLDIPLCTVGGVVSTQHGDVILIMHQYAYTGKGPTIHSAGQIEAFGNTVDDKSTVVGGKQHIVIKYDPINYVIPLGIVRGLVRMPMRPYTDGEFERLPHVILTSDVPWDPAILDHVWQSDDPAWHATVSDPKSVPNFDAEGNYLQRTITMGNLRNMVPNWLVKLTRLSRSKDDTDGEDAADPVLHAMEHDVKPAKIDYESHRKHFLWLPVDTVKHTFDKTTQYARMPVGTRLKQFFKSPFPALNHPRRSEDVATDTVYSDTPAIDSGATMAQLFVGLDSTVTDVYPMKTEKQFVNTLEDNIRERGAMSRLISDRAASEISQRVKDILRALFIRSWQSEPDHQHQNFAERRINTIKDATNRLMELALLIILGTWLWTTSVLSSTTVITLLLGRSRLLVPLASPLTSVAFFASSSGSQFCTGTRMTSTFPVNPARSRDASLALPTMSVTL